MKILAIGDVVGAAGVAYLQEKLSKIKEALGAAFVVVNGENAAEIHGISSTAAKQLLDCGADIITLGNHTFGRKDICQMLSDEANKNLTDMALVIKVAYGDYQLFAVAYRVLVPTEAYLQGHHIAENTQLHAVYKLIVGRKNRLFLLDGFHYP